MAWLDGRPGPPYRHPHRRYPQLKKSMLIILSIWNNNVVYNAEVALQISTVRCQHSNKYVYICRIKEIKSVGVSKLAKKIKSNNFGPKFLFDTAVEMYWLYCGDHLFDTTNKNFSFKWELLTCPHPLCCPSFLVKEKRHRRHLSFYLRRSTVWRDDLVIQL